MFSSVHVKQRRCQMKMLDFLIRSLLQESSFQLVVKRFWFVAGGFALLFFSNVKCKHGYMDTDKNVSCFFYFLLKY